MPLRRASEPPAAATATCGTEDRGLTHRQGPRSPEAGAKCCDPGSQREHEAGSSGTPSACSRQNAPPPPLACILGSQSEDVHISLRCAVKKKKKKSSPHSVCAVDVCVLRSRSLIWNLDSDYVLA